MLLLMYSLTLSMFISTVLILLSCLLYKKHHFYREKSTPFECGFDPMNSSRVPFSVRFFLIAIVFLIFDIEISILLPLGIILGNIPPLSLALTSLAFLTIVTLGLYYEWYENTLEWMN